MGTGVAAPVTAGDPLTRGLPIVADEQIQGNQGHAGEGTKPR